MHMHHNLDRYHIWHLPMNHATQMWSHVVYSLYRVCRWCRRIVYDIVSSFGYHIVCVIWSTYWLQFKLWCQSVIFSQECSNATNLRHRACYAGDLSVTPGCYDASRKNCDKKSSLKIKHGHQWISWMQTKTTIRISAMCSTLPSKTSIYLSKTASSRLR